LAPTMPSVQEALTQGVPAISDHGTKQVTGLAELALEADDYYFAPTYLQGGSGQALTLTVNNHSGTLHNLSIPDLQIDRDLPPQGKAKVQITFPFLGSMRFFCKIHAAMGMNGELRIGSTIPESQAGSRN
jgi:plastocyanin